MLTVTYSVSNSGIYFWWGISIVNWGTRDGIDLIFLQVAEMKLCLLNV